MCIQQKYNVYTADIWIVNTAEYQIPKKIMKNELKQVQMAPFGLIFDRVNPTGSRKPLGYLPGFKTRQKSKKFGFSGLKVYFPYFPLLSL